MTGILAAQLVGVRLRQALHRRTRSFLGSSVALGTVPRQESASLEQMVVLVPAGGSGNMEGRETSGSPVANCDIDGMLDFLRLLLLAPYFFQAALSAKPVPDVTAVQSPSSAVFQAVGHTRSADQRKGRHSGGRSRPT